MMQLKEACSILARIEQEKNVNSIILDDVLVWPLIRQCLWVELLNQGKVSTSKSPKNILFDFLLLLVRMSRRVRAKLAAFSRHFLVIPDQKVTTLFFSRPVYLQKIEGTPLFFDRIVDTLFFLSRNKEKVAKFYTARWPGEELYFPASVLRMEGQWAAADEMKHIKVLLGDMALMAGLPKDRFIHKVTQSWRQFLGWRRVARKVFLRTPRLKRVFVTSWYFPDMMGIVAAAKESGIETIDVQHGKQGKYQGMYSWWTAIPENGYQMMPDHFWCWGQPSCAHILASSQARRLHRPFVGGFPWLDFYRNFLSQEEAGLLKPGCIVLVTLQPPVGLHTEPIPDFLVEYLSSPHSHGKRFIFRCHPNDRGRIDYCKQRLEGISAEIYTISDGVSNLFDALLKVTHHITAYSSCCYEADAFGVPTLLFGSDARDIYAEEIDSGVFAWTEGRAEDLQEWLETKATSLDGNAEQHKSSYIVSSLSLARNALEQQLS